MLTELQFRARVVELLEVIVSLQQVVVQSIVDTDSWSLRAETEKEAMTAMQKAEACFKINIAPKGEV